MGSTTHKSETKAGSHRTDGGKPFERERNRIGWDFFLG